MSSETLHVSTVAIGGRAVMIGGESGAGKSDMALRLVDRGAVLVSDDYTVATRNGSRLIASPPATIAGKIEVRGIGVADMPHVSDVPVALCIDLVDAVERMPGDPGVRTIAGVAIPLVLLNPHEPSAAIKAELAVERWGTK